MYLGSLRTVIIVILITCDDDYSIENCYKIKTKISQST